MTETEVLPVSLNAAAKQMEYPASNAVEEHIHRKHTALRGVIWEVSGFAGLKHNVIHSHSYMCN